MGLSTYGAAGSTLTAAIVNHDYSYELLVSQRLQYPLIKEYTLNHSRDPTII